MNRLHPTFLKEPPKIRYPRRKPAWSSNIYSWEILREFFSTPKRNIEITVDLLRHGESTANTQKLITGQANVPLSRAGKVQAKRVGRVLEPSYDFAWSSTLTRSIDTLSLALEAGSVKVGSIYQDPRLNELNFGVMENEAQQFIPAYANGDIDFAPAEGESYRDLSQRALSFLLDLIKLCDHRPVRVLISTHQGPMRVLTGIINEDETGMQVLARKFKNTHLERLKITRLAFPHFLETENNERLSSTKSAIY